MKKHFNSRRNFIKSASAGIAGTLALPVIAKSNDNVKPEINRELQGEEFWEMVKKQFSIPKGKIMVNSANLCPSPHFIQQRVTQSAESLNSDVSFQSRGVYNEMRAQALKDLSAFVGCDEKEIGITRNTSESNNIVVNGLELKKGDEVLIWDQNHPTNNLAWIQRGKRVGFSVKSFSTPESPKSKSELLEVVAASISSKTRLIAFSHISNVSGIAMPVKEICQMARSKDIMTLVDGAQSFGFLDLNLEELGCDFFSSSTHKWLMGPMENGILFMRERHIKKLWPTIIAPGWDEEHDSVDERFCKLGQRNRTTTSAISDILEFHEMIGKDKVEERVFELAAYLKSELTKNLPGIAFVTPEQKELSGGVVIFNIPNKEPVDLFSKLYEDHQIAAAPTGGVRLSPNIHTTLKDLDRVVAALKGMV